MQGGRRGDKEEEEEEKEEKEKEEEENKALNHLAKLNRGPRSLC